MMIANNAADAVRYARAANRRAIRHAAHNGTRDVGGMLYRAHERAERDSAMLWARRYALAARKARGCTDRQLVATINSTSKRGPLSVELRAFRAEADRRRAMVRA